MLSIISLERLCSFSTPILYNRRKFDKNANFGSGCMSLCVSTPLRRVGLATTEVCVFCAATLVAALFILERGNNMEEKIIIESKTWGLKQMLAKFSAFIFAICFVFCLFYILTSFGEIRKYDSYMEDVKRQGGYAHYMQTRLDQIQQEKSDAIAEIVDTSISILFLPIITSLPFFFAIYYALFKNTLVITDYRAYGQIAFGKRVDIPLDSISSVSTIPLFKSISLSSSSGRIRFPLMKNSDELYEHINSLLIQRQNTIRNQTQVNFNHITNSADEIKKYKQLLDMGAITQEEFDAKKKQLLGL